MAEKAKAKTKPKTKIAAVTPLDSVEINGEQVLIFKANEVLGPSALKALSNAIRYEQTASKCKIVLVPFSIDSIEVGNDQ